MIGGFAEGVHLLTNCRARQPCIRLWTKIGCEGASLLNWLNLMNFVIWMGRHVDTNCSVDTERFLKV